MATEGVSNDGGAGGASGVGGANDAGGVDASDKADVSSAADSADAGDVDAEAADIAGDDDGFEVSGASAGGVDAAADVDAAEDAAAADVEAEAAAAAAAEVEEAKKAEEAALEAALAANPAAPLADPNMTRAELDAHLQGLSTPELTGVVKGVDQPELEYGAKVTEQGWEALRAEIDSRFDTAFEQKDWANPELADLSVEAVRQRDFGGLGPSYSERSYRQVADGFNSISEDPAVQAVDAKLDHATQLEQHHINGGLPVSEMTNGQLMDSVRAIPGMRAFGDIASLSGVGMIAGFAAEAKADERMTELQARIDDGRITGVTPQELSAPNTASRVVGGLALAAEVASVVNPKSWGRDLISAAKGLFRHGDDVARTLNKAFNGVPVGELRSPNASRHLIDSIGPKSFAKGTTTVAERGVDVAGDVAAIRRGEGVIVGDRITINGRTYGAHDGTLYPIEGAGLHQLDRGTFKAIQEMRRAGSVEGAQRALDGMGVPQEARELAATLLGLR